MPPPRPVPRSRIPFRKAWWYWLISRTFLYDALIALFVGLGGIANSLRAGYAGDYLPMALWIMTAVGGLLFTIARIIVLVIESRSAESVHELLGCLHVLYRQLVGDGIGDTRLRITIHVPSANRKQLQQIVDYVSDDAESAGMVTGVGRVKPVHVGIAGRAYRTKQYIVAERESQDPNAFVAELVKNWSFTEEEAAEIDQASKCWLAVPIILTEESSVQGVLYADATVAQFFTDDRLKMAFAACAGIATYVARRYK